MEKLEEHIDVQDQKIAAQNLTIDVLETMTNERFASVAKNFQAVDPGNTEFLNNIYV